MSYIKAKEVLSLFNDLVNECVDKDDFYNRAFDVVDAMPTADVVEVVRCKDCKYYEIHKPTITLNCEREGKLVPMMPDDFCSYGERRTEE